jgi:hypothetical protein
MTNSAISPEVLDAQIVNLNSATTKGMNDWEIESMETSVADINEHLAAAGSSLRYVASELAQIKQNVKTGNWKAFLESGVLSCSPKYATDLVAAHDKWLCNADVEDAVIAQLTPRSLAALANQTEAVRQKVYKMISSAGKTENITEAKIRSVWKKKGAAKSAVDRTPDEKLKRANTLNKQLTEMNRKLKAENADLRRQLSKKLLEVQ